MKAEAADATAFALFRWSFCWTVVALLCFCLLPPLRLFPFTLDPSLSIHALGAGAPGSKGNDKDNGKAGDNGKAAESGGNGGMGEHDETLPGGKGKAKGAYDMPGTQWIPTNGLLPSVLMERLRGILSERSRALQLRSKVGCSF